MYSYHSAFRGNFYMLFKFATLYQVSVRLYGGDVKDYGINNSRNELA